MPKGYQPRKNGRAAGLRIDTYTLFIIITYKFYFYFKYLY